MGNPASEKLIQAVRAAKSSAADAEREYDRGADRIQRMASQSIDLFGGSAVSRVADIASESRRVCDALYASYQTLIRMLDAECRPLLDQGPDYHAVREVRDLIKWLNDESEIENNFTASINSHSLGGIVSGRYIPTIENKMIQSFWESKYNMWPGRAEAEAAERKRQQEEEERRRQEAEQKRREETAAYEKEYAEWKQKTEEIEARRSAALETRLAAASAARTKEIETTRSAAVKKASREKTACEKKLTEEKEKLAALGFFKFAEKNAAKAAIETLTATIAAAEAAIAEAEQSYRNDEAAHGAWLEDKKEQIQGELEKLYPMPPKPRKPSGCYSSYSQQNSEELKEAILAWMVPGELYTISELLEEVPELSEVSSVRVSVLLRQMADEGVERVDIKRQSYFRLSI